MHSKTSSLSPSPPPHPRRSQASFSPPARQSTLSARGEHAEDPKVSGNINNTVSSGTDRALPTATRRFHSPKSRKKYNIVVHVGSEGDSVGEATKFMAKDSQDNTIGANLHRDTPHKSNEDLLYYPSSIPIDFGTLKQFTAPLSSTHQYVYHEVSGRLEQVVFPSVEPTSRVDTVQLDRWMQKYMRMDDSTLDRLKGVLEGADCSKAADVARRNLNVLDMAHAELVRQVAYHCHERGVLMMQMWQASRDMFESILREQQSVMLGLHRRVLDAVNHTQLVQGQMEEVQRAHAAHVLGLASTSRAREHAVDKDAETIRNLRQKIFAMEKEVKLMQDSIADASIWFPGFLQYRKCDLRDELPCADWQEQEGHSSGDAVDHVDEDDQSRRAAAINLLVLEDTLQLPESILCEEDRLVFRDVQRVHRALARRATAALSLRDDPAVVPFPSAASSSRRTAEEDGSFSGEEPRPSASFSVPSLSALSDGHGADQLIPDT